jgi:hypothetical protein
VEAGHVGCHADSLFLLILAKTNVTIATIATAESRRTELRRFTPHVLTVPSSGQRYREATAEDYLG